MNTERKSFIEELRSLNEPTKRKVALGTTIVSMVVVIYFWLAYFNTTIQNTTNVTVVQLPTETSAPTTGAGLGSLFVNAANSLWETTIGGAKNIAGVLEGSRQYNINPKR